MCLFDHEEKVQNNYHQFFREFFKYKQGSNLINESVDTLIDFFPQRSAINIGKLSTNTQKVSKLGNEYMSTILGRQIFNFQITSSTLENLFFELCEIFNQKPKSIDLLQIYSKIIHNQKITVMDSCTELYLNLCKQLQSQLPMQHSELLEAHSVVWNTVVKESLVSSYNCMDFQEYSTIHTQLQSICDRKFKQIINDNKCMLRQRMIGAFEVVEEGVGEEEEGEGEEGVKEGFEIVGEKISMFVEECVMDVNTKEMVLRVVGMLLESLGDKIQEKFEEIVENQNRNKIQLENYRYENKLLEQKCKRLETQCIYLNSLNEEYQQKLLTSEFSISNSVVTQQNIVLLSDLKKKIIDLEIQLSEKNQVIMGMEDILNKFQIDFQRKYSKPKFNQEMQFLLSEVSQKVNQIYSVSSDLKKTQQLYQELQLKFDKKKQQLIEKLRSQQQQIQSLTEKLNRCQEEKRILEVILEQARQTIEVMKNVDNECKDSINQLQNSCSNYKCIMADFQGNFQKYKKALSLMCSYCCTGKIDKIKNFYKVCDEDELKQIIKPIFNK